MPDDAIASVADGTTRAAFLALRSEMFRMFERTEAQITTVSSKVEVYVATAAQQRVQDLELRTALQRSSEQDRASMARVADRFDASFQKHCESDEAFKEQVAKTFGVWQKYLIVTLVTMVGALIGAIGTLVLHIVK